jgi:hypothetical protein
MYLTIDAGKDGSGPKLETTPWISLGWHPWDRQQEKVLLMLEELK